MKNSKNIIIVLIAVLILAVLFYAYFASKVNNQNTDSEVLDTPESSQNTQTQNNINSGSNTSTKAESKSYIGIDGIYVVRYTDDGFVPSSIQIAKGKSIRFINQSSKGMRIFFEEQTDSGKKEYNQPETVGNGSTYTMSFVNGGLWVYYNGALPAHRANILVY